MKSQLIVLLLLFLFLTGCWDRRELNELAITLAVAIDKVDDEFQVTAQVVVPSEVAAQKSTGHSTVTLYQEEGITASEAFRKITLQSPRKLYLGHLRMLVIGEDLAQEGIAEFLDLLARDWELRSDFYVVLARDTEASEILNVTTTVESIPANKMFETLRTSSDAWAVTKGVTLNELFSNLASDGKNPVLTGIQVIGNQKAGSSKQNVESITPETKIVYDHLAVFKKDKMVGWLTESESRGYNYITDSVKTTVTKISCPEGKGEGKVSIEVMQAKSTMKGNVKNGDPEVDIKIKEKGNVRAVECQIDLEKPETIDELEKIYELEMKENIQQTIETVQKQYKTDVFGFGEAIHRSNPKEWKSMKDEWDEKFTDLVVNVEVDLEINLTGTAGNSLLKKVRE